MTDEKGLNENKRTEYMKALYVILVVVLVGTMIAVALAVGGL